MKNASMRRFEWLEIHEALAWSASGGVALHMNPIAKNMPHAPICFKRSKEAAHMFDLDTERLVANARRYGITRIYIDKANTANQHIDLCGKPLERALKECDQPQLNLLE